MAKPRIPISIPRGQFTSADLAVIYPAVSNFVFHQRIQEWIAEGKVKVVGTTSVRRGGKGRYVYQPQEPLSQASVVP